MTDKFISLRYSSTASRDLRIDFLRGVAMVIMIITHIEILSIFNLFTWERFGLVSGAEGFVILSGFVLGQVNNQKMATEAPLTCYYRLWRRAGTLYLVNLFIIISVLLLAHINLFNSSEITHFTDRLSGQQYSLYPALPESLENWFNLIIYLQIGPHQSQILGLYVLLLIITPMIITLLLKKKTPLILLISWSVYIFYQINPTTLTNAEFERAFPIMAWQLIYVHGLVAGWHKHTLHYFAGSPLGKAIIAGCIIGALMMLVIAQSMTNPFIPNTFKLPLLTIEQFNLLYFGFAQKNMLGPLRVFNDLCILVSMYVLLTYLWKPIYVLIGWLLVPLGQYSLYIFILHVYIVWIISQFTHFGFSNPQWLLNTLVHASALLVLWWMATRKIGARFIPN